MLWIETNDGFEMAVGVFLDTWRDVDNGKSMTAVYVTPYLDNTAHKLFVGTEAECRAYSEHLKREMAGGGSIRKLLDPGDVTGEAASELAFRLAARLLKLKGPGSDDQRVDLLNFISRSFCSKCGRIGPKDCSCEKDD